MSNVRNIHFEAVGSYLRPAELKEARAKFADGKISATDLRAVEDRPRPPVWRGREVPEVLLSGHHANIAKWRRQQSLQRTLERRPDLLERADLTKADKKILETLKANKIL